jgi:lipopolysaccharide/colanic/teichoic acid biosynthesis glycosyltransferase
MMKVYPIAKRIIDCTLSFMAMIILLPIFLTIAVLIKLDSKGPIFFKQDRLGKHGKIFKIYKFRTMCNDAENKGTGLFTHNMDPRITRVGKLLRKTSLDELPQVINILKGEMSIIGPRPPVPYFPRRYEEYDNNQKLRFTVLPGLTGLAQVLVRTTATWDERIEIDLLYVKNLSMTQDIEIFIKTVISVFFAKNIYPSVEEIKRRAKDASM